MLVSKNPDTEFVAEIKKKIKDNNGYCPCSVTRTLSDKCICKEFADQVERGEEGMCRCGLYIATND